MIGSFKANIPYNNFLLFFYGIILRWSIFLHPILPSKTPASSFLYKKILIFLESFGHSIPVIYSVIVFILIFVQAITINTLVSNQKLFAKSNYLTGMCYLLFTGLFPSLNKFSPAIIITTLLIGILSLLCKLFNQPEVKKNLYNIGLIFGFCILLYFPAIYFLLPIMISLSYLRPFKIKEWVIFILGIITPIYFLLTYLYYFDIRISELFSSINFKLPAMKFNDLEWIAMAVIIFTVIIGFVFVQNNRRKLLVQSRKVWSMMIWFLIATIIQPFLSSDAAFLSVLPLFFPMAAIAAAAYYYPNRNWFSFISHWGMVILCLLTNYFFTQH